MASCALSQQQTYNSQAVPQNLPEELLSNLLNSSNKSLRYTTRELVPLQAQDLEHLLNESEVWIEELSQDVGSYANKPLPNTIYSLKKMLEEIRSQFGLITINKEEDGWYITDGKTNEKIEGGIFSNPSKLDKIKVGEKITLKFDKDYRKHYLTRNCISQMTFVEKGKIEEGKIIYWDEVEGYLINKYIKQEVDACKDDLFTLLYCLGKYSKPNSNFKNGSNKINFDDLKKEISEEEVESAKAFSDFFSLTPTDLLLFFEKKDGQYVLYFANQKTKKTIYLPENLGKLIEDSQKIYSISKNL